MSDVAKLLEKFEQGALLRPDPARPNLVDLARALARVAGVEEVDRTAGVARLLNLIGAPDHLVFVLADGLGMNLLDELPRDSFLAAHLAAELRAVFPSTTATVLTTLATGEWPNRHGVTGQWTHLPEIHGAAALLPFAARAGGRSLGSLGVAVEQAFPVPSLMGRMRREVLAVFPSRLVGSVSSAYFTGARPRVGYERLSQAAEIILDWIDRAPAPTYTYLYTPWIDSETHYLGVRHAGVRAVLNELSQAVERLACGVGRRGRIVLAADHGFLDAPVSARHAIKPSPELFSLLRFASSGDDRVLYFHLRDGSAERLRERLKGQFGDRFLLISVDEAEEHGLFGPGPLAANVRERFGDVVLISSGVDVIEYVPTARVGRRVDLNAFHSGLSPEEMRVPLVIA